MMKSKIFFGATSGSNACTADIKMNDWIDKKLKEGLIVEIDQFRYQQARYGDHSIAILYHTIPKGVSHD